MDFKSFLPSRFRNDLKRPSQSDVMQNILVTQQFRTKASVDAWRRATDAAERILYPNRTELYRTYREVDLDDQIETVTKNRINKVLSKKFKLVNKAGKEVPEKTALLQKMWMRKFITYAMESKWWGHSLVQFGDVIGTASKGDIRFASIKLVPREHVMPDFHLVTNYPGLIVGKDYLEKPFVDWVVPIGDEKDLGLYLKAAPHVIYKRNSLVYWADFCEMFGMPFRMGKTNMRDPESRATMEAMLQGMGSRSWAALDREDEITLAEVSQNSKGMNVYDLLMSRCDKALAKMFLGATGTTDEKSFVGAAKVHQDVSNEFMAADLEWLQFLINDELLPRLNTKGWALEGLSFKYDESLDIASQWVIDEGLLPHYKIPTQYILEKYGTPVEDKPEAAAPIAQPLPKDAKNRLNKYYS